MISRLILVCLLFGMLPARAANAPSSEAEPATFEFWDREIITFRATLAGQTPETRRSNTMRRIQALEDFDIYKEVEMVPVSAGELEGMAFEIGGKRLFVMVEEDLDPTESTTFEDATGEALTRLKALRQAWLDQKDAGVILRGILMCLVALVVVVAIWFGLNRLGRVIRRFFSRRAHKLGKLKRQNFDLRPVVLQFNRRLVGFVVACIGFTAGFLGLTFMLSQFPYTQPWAKSLGQQLALLFDSLFDGFLQALPGLLVVVLIFFLTRGTSRIVAQLLESFENSDEDNEVIGKDTAKATRRIAGALVWVAGLVIAYPYIPGSDSAAFKGVSVLLGLMFSLGSSGFINQFMSGFVVLYSGAVRSGEYVMVGGVEGTVTEIGLLSTLIRTPKNEFVSVPNAVLITKESYNYSRRQPGGEVCQFSTGITIGYDTPWQQVHELLLEAAGTTSGIRAEPKPYVLQKALTDFYAEYELRFAPGQVEGKGRVLSALHERIQTVFHNAGVQIMSPNFVAQPVEPVVPPAACAEG